MSYPRSIKEWGERIMKGLIVFVYGVISYVIGLGGLVWFALYIGGWDFLPRHVDSEVTTTTTVALTVNAGLLALFVLQHSVMARLSFKEHWLKVIPYAVERSTYILLSGIIMALICLYWQPLEGMLWQVSSEPIRYLLIALYIAGWMIAVISSFLINHFELFGLQQVYFNLIKRAQAEPHFVERSFYKIVRHPIQFGTLVGIWATPDMSMTHFVLSACLTVYIFIGLYYEEKDLVATLGDKYADYQKRRPMIMPLFK